MGITVLAGRIKSATTGIVQAQDAERLGFKRIWLPERYNIKEAGVMVGAMAARTGRIGVGAGPLSVFSRPPVVTAAIGATMQSLVGDLFTLGLGRSNAAWIAGHRFTEAGYQGIVDYARIVKQLWAGETVDYGGPAGSFHGLTMIDRPEDVPPPKVVFFHLGGPVASKVAADPVFDQVALCNLTSAEVMARSIVATRSEAERIGRDPESLYFIAPVTTAPDLDERATRAMVAARSSSASNYPAWGRR
jgi:alkanesulfonate monooxygenase SsuD/methylene tetrahydromethanopterin reductase-like flavin-dependent oxidoreductase (luciferase family)